MKPSRNVTGICINLRKSQLIGKVKGSRSQEQLIYINIIWLIEIKSFASK